MNDKHHKEDALTLSTSKNHLSSNNARGTLVNRKAAAEFLGLKVATLADWASSNRYPLPYIKVGKLAKYRLSDLENFLAQNLKSKMLSETYKKR